MCLLQRMIHKPRGLAKSMWQQHNKLRCAAEVQFVKMTSVLHRWTYRNWLYSGGLRHHYHLLQSHGDVQGCQAASSTNGRWSGQWTQAHGRCQDAGRSCVRSAQICWACSRWGETPTDYCTGLAFILHTVIPVATKPHTVSVEWHAFLFISVSLKMYYRRVFCNDFDPEVCFR